MFNNPTQKHFIESAFEIQKELNKFMDKDMALDCKEHQVRNLLRHAMAVNQEVSELIDSVPWKWWSKQEVNMQNAKVEIVDIFCFVINMAMISGMGHEEFSELYLKKSELNFKRQQEGYKNGTYKKVVDGKEDNEGLFE